MLLLLQRLKALSHSAATPLGILLGIPLGILLEMPYSIGFFLLLGWVLIPLNFIKIVSGDSTLIHPFGLGGLQWPQWVIWGLRGVVLFYLLFLFCSGLCAYRATRHSGILADGLLSAAWVALVTLLTAILSATLAIQWEQGHSLSVLLFHLGEAAQDCAFLLVPFYVMALLVGLAGAVLGSRSSPHTHIRDA